MQDDRRHLPEMQKLSAALVELRAALGAVGVALDRVELCSAEQVCLVARRNGTVARGRDADDPALWTSLGGVDIMATPRPKVPGVRYGADGKRYSRPYGFSMMLVGDVIRIPADEAQHSKLESLKVRCSTWGTRLRRQFRCQELSDGSREIVRLE